jgi:hypothetical protein
MEEERPLFQGMDELERTYAPEELSPDDPEYARVRADEGGKFIPGYAGEEPPAAAPVANMGNAPSAAAAPPNIGHVDHGGAPGDPQTQAGYPLDSDDEEDNPE